MNKLIPSFIADKYSTGETSGSFSAAVLFLDVTGFTAMTQALMANGKEGAEALNSLLKTTFEPVIDAVYDRGGFISSFEGDAFTAIFPRVEAPLDCCYAALNITEIFAKIGHQETRFGAFDLSIKIGLANGDVEWGIIGSKLHKTYYFRGNAIDDCAKAEQACEGMQIILTSKFAKRISDEIKTAPASVSFSRLIRVIPKEPKRVPSVIQNFPREVALQFLPESVIDFQHAGEFRDVSCAFISFKEQDVNGFAGFVLEKAYELGGYFEGLNFGDKGGNCLVIFGAPVSYENNTQRAVDFAGAIRAEFKDSVRVGVTFGTVFAGLKGSNRRAIYGVIGSIVNLSARFMMKAVWGEIWLDDAASKHLKTAHDTEPLEPMSFKGFDRKVMAHRLLDNKTSARVSIFAGEMVGREEEKAQLVEWLKPIQEGKFGGIVTVYGNPGIGKSRLLYEVTNRQERQVARSSAHPAGFHTCLMQTDSILKKSLNPISYFFNHYFEQAEAGSVEERKARFAAIYQALVGQVSNLSSGRVASHGSWRADTAVRPESEVDLTKGRTGVSDLQEVVKELKRVEPLIGSLVGLYWEGSIYDQIEPKNRPLSIQFAVKEFFKALSLIEPIVLLIEDIQWLDDESQALFAILTRKVEDFPIVILASSRFNDDGSKPILKVDKEILQNGLELTELSDDNLQSLIANLLGAPADAELAAYIQSRTEGNPFYAEQFCLYLRENDLLTLSPSQILNLKSQILNSSIPISINAIMIARIDRLSGELKRTVQVASVLGREFEVRVLQELIELLHQAEVHYWHTYRDGGIESLVSGAEKERIWSALSELRYIFRHALLRDAVYEMQMKLQIRSLHQLAGETMEKLYPEDKTKLADIADHYEKGEVWEKAAEYLFKAAEDAKDRYDNTNAIVLFNRLLYINQSHELVLTNEVIIKTLLGKGNVLELVGKWGEAAEQYEMARTISENQGGKYLLAKALSFRGNLLHLKGDPSKGLECLELSLSIATELGNKQEIARANGLIGHIFYNRGNYERALECYQIWLSLVREIGDSRGISQVLSSMGMVHYSRGDYDQAIEVQQKSLALSEELGDKRGISAAVSNMGIVYYRRGEHDRALELFNRKLFIAQELGDKRGMAQALGNMGGVYAERGENDDALRCDENCFAIFEELGDRRGIALASGNIGFVHYSRRNFDQALEYFQKNLSIAEELEDRQAIALAVGNIGNVYYEQGSYELALACQRRRLSIAEEVGDRLGISEAEGNMGLVFFELGDLSRALECQKRRLDIAEELGDKLGTAYAVGNMVNVFMESGDYQQAEKSLERLVEIYGELQLKHELASSYYLRAKTALAQNDRTCAHEACQIALRMATEVDDHELIHSIKSLAIRIAFHSGATQLEMQSAVAELMTLGKETESEELLADIHYELVSMHRTLNNPDQADHHRLEAIRLYEGLYAKIPKYAFKKRVEELMTFA